MVDYSDRLTASMQQAGVSVTRLAARLGVSYQAVKKVLDGKSKCFSAENNARAAALLGISPDWLVTGKGDSAARSLSTPIQRQSSLEDSLGNTLNPLVDGVMSPEARDIAVHFDLLRHDSDRSSVYVNAMNAIMKTLSGRMTGPQSQPDAAPTPAQAPFALAEKLAAEH